jgi:pilus assembly protein CpaE
MAKPRRRISLLIVDDVADTRSNLAKLLQFEEDMQVVGSEGSGKEGIARARELRPDVILMDINLPDIDGIRATEIITRELPGTGVIMLSIQGDTDYLRRAMQAGARQFLVKPFSGDELMTVIRQVDALEAGRRDQPATPVRPASPPVGRSDGCKTLAVFSPKGGVGCSTVAVNLAVALKQSTGKRVALVDGSLRFGDVALMLNLHDGKTIADLVPLIDQLDEDLLRGIMTTHSSGVQVLTAPPRPEMAELVTADATRRILAMLKTCFDFVIVDTWGSFEDTVLAILDTADQILLVITMEMPCIKDARLFLEVAEALKYPKEKILLVVNRFDAGQTISIQDVERSVRHRVDWKISSGGHLVAQAINQGVPFVIANREAPVARSMRVMADEIGRAAEPETADGVPEASATPPARPLLAGSRRLSFLGRRG